MEMMKKMLEKFGMENLKDSLDKDIEEWTQTMIAQQEQEQAMAEQQAAEQQAMIEQGLI